MNLSIQKIPILKNSSILLLILTLFIQTTSSFHWDGNIVYDLETNTEPDFAIEAAQWYLSSYFATPGVNYYKCANNYILGGYEVLGGSGLSGSNPYDGQYYQRTYSSVPTHNQIYIQMQFYQIDSWDIAVPPNTWSDHFEIVIDGNVIYGWDLSFLYPGLSPICGIPGQPDLIFPISLAYPHSASSLTLRMVVHSDENSFGESLGFRDIKIEFLTNTSPYFSLCAPGVSSSYLSSSRCRTSCTSSGNSISPASYGFCFPSASCSSNCRRCSDTIATCTCCQTGWYLIGTTCYPSCNYPLSTKTLGGVIYCETPCSGQYVWWDQSCFSSCSYTTTYGSYAITGITVNTFQECTYPCLTTQYLYWNTSCLSSCPGPLTPTVYKGRKFCEYPCTSSGHLYWNGSCLGTCSSPLVPETQSSSQPRNFCWYPCAETQYLYWNGSCLNTCPSPLAPEIQGTSSQRKFCWYTCSETQYLYWNGSCLNTCPYPLAPEIQQGTFSSRQFCWYPCQPSEYFYWNGSCLNNCPSPLALEIQGTFQQRNFCWYPCHPSEYLYWNGSCLNTCPYPLAPEVQQGVSSSRNFCWYSCQPSEYLFWNGSCLSTCPSPLSPETQGTIQQRNFCWYTCDVTEHLYWNQSCSSQCPIPLVSFNLSSNLFCFLPCSMPNIYWYQDLSCRLECNFPYNLIYRDSVQQCLKPCSRPSEHFYDLEKECHDTCDPPYVRQIINTIKVCHIDASTLSSEIDKIKSTVEVIETLGKITSGMIKAASVPQLSTPRSTLLIQLSAIMQYIRYMRINYPWRVRLLFEENGSELISLSFDFSIPNIIQDKFDNYPLPDVFEKYGLDSSFINNMWDLMTSALLVIFGILILLLFKPIFKKYRKLNHMIMRILQSLRWNTPIAMISGGAGEIIFYASLQIRNTPLGSAISIVSFFISLLMIFWVIVILVVCLKILRGFHLQRKKRTPNSSSENQDWLDKWKGYEILYEEIEEKYLLSLAYMVIYVIRAILFFAIIANLYDYPLIQSILINVINLFIFLYLLCYKPLKDMWNTIQLLINEILGNIITICVLVLAIMDKAQIEARYSRVTVGNVIIGVMLTFYILGVVFLVIEGVLFLIEAYKTWKEMRAKGIKNPFKMIQILLFGETAKTHPEEITLELSQNSSRWDTSHARLKRNYLQKSYDNKIIDHNNEIKERNSSNDVPLNSSSRFLSPNHRANPTGTQINESDIQNTEYGIDTSRINRPIGTNNKSRKDPDSNPPNKINPDDSPSGLVLSKTTEPTLLNDSGFIKSWGNLKARMKRFNESIYKSNWVNQE